MKVLVHIGTEKTGTTSIQQYLHLNRGKLRKAGYHFNQSAGDHNNRAFPAYCIADEKFDDFFQGQGISTLSEKQQFKRIFIEQFEAELEGLPKNIHTVIVSSEHFHSSITNEEEMDNVYNLLSRYFDEIKIVCYLREQVATCVSYYSTHLMNGGTQSFDEFLKRCKPKIYYFNYSTMLANWERCFGFESLEVSLFSKDHLLNRDLLDDFTAKIDSSLVGNLDKEVELENQSLRPAGQVLERIVNLVFPVRSEIPEVAAIRHKCKNAIAISMKGRGQQPDLETWQRLYDSFIECNEDVREKFFPQLEKIFARPEKVDAEHEIIDLEFSQLLMSLIRLVKKNRSDKFLPSVYARFWSAVSTCVTDVANVEGVDFGKGPPPVALDVNDVRLLKNAYYSLAGIKPKQALKLMALVNKVGPLSHEVGWEPLERTEVKFEKLKILETGPEIARWVTLYTKGFFALNSEGCGEIKVLLSNNSKYMLNFKPHTPCALMYTIRSKSNSIVGVPTAAIIEIGELNPFESIAKIVKVDIPAIYWKGLKNIVISLRIGEALFVEDVAPLHVTSAQFAGFSKKN